MAQRTYYRIVGKSRTEDEEVLRSRSGRFHENDDPATSYCAESLATAWAEVTARFAAARPNPEAFRAYRVNVESENLSDLRDDNHVAELMTDPAPPECKSRARELRSGPDRVDGLVYPSMRNPEGECVVLFLENVADVSLEPVPEEEWETFLEGLERE